ncbi:hypothetical protein SmJEL517_g01155 [Synchytrium microbalum]|uniref:Cilia- and flagella-associated protein 91 n=1 Tax=Synchytrium microbalum TaxID=1806994 RepID=A0A507CGH8_9FUNG|nr:uncharacterized protein SmJEL517_g01155 [Synchytrium microbalum]TPX36613.1 hypothetical protein SmJEL517_g01155 [Synchytrium microbalum]
MSTTQTHTVAASLVPNRPHDYLYDSTYTVANRADHVKHMAASTRADVVIVPNFSNMFSALAHHPSASMTLRPHLPPPGLGQDRVSRGGDPQVSGAGRYRYFRRPLVPYLPNMNGPIVYAKSASANGRTENTAPAAEDVSGQPRTRTVFVQTIFRESEAQTDPYSPDYVAIPNADGQLPEVLTLMSLKYGQGLPAGVAELDLIERGRAKRAWEASLPTGSDPASLQRRFKAMEAMELAEWAEREEEIAKIQEARLKIMETILRKREDDEDKDNADRIEKMWERRMRAREILLDKIQRKRVKAMRKLTEKLKNVENKFVRRDIIAEYADHGSKVYAPKAREGMPVDQVKDALKLHLEELSHYEGLVALESSFPPQVLQADMSGPESLIMLRKQRQDMALHDELNAMDRRIKERMEKEAALERPLRFCSRIEKPVQRPATPTVDIPEEEDEERTQAALLLQRLIRGRVQQEEMRRGLERRKDLIAEMRSRHMIRRAALLPNPSHLEQTPGATDVGKAPIEVECETIEKDTLFQPTTTESTRLDDLVTSTLHSEHTSRALSFLTSELVRLREERRIAAMLKLATRTREEREAAESSRRMEELARREQADSVFMNVMKVHHQTVDMYLEDIVRESIDSTSDELAREQVYEHAVRVETEAKNTTSDDISIVRDLVSQFLIPEVERDSLRQQIRDDQRKYLLAAHTALASQLPTIESSLNSSL